ncbi:hypothetical protein Tco_0513386 [Tanacetum coccineum]
MSIPSLRPCIYDTAALLVCNYGVICEDEAKRRNSGAKTKTFEEYSYLLPYAVSSKEDTAYQRQLITRIRDCSYLAEQIDVDNLDEATRVSIAIARSVEEYETQHAVKKVDGHLLDEDIEKLVESEESDANKFADDMMLSQEDPGTRIVPGSYKESPNVKKVIEYVFVDEEVEEETIDAALIRRKRKGSLEIRNTPLTTPTRFLRTITDFLSSDKEKLKELMASKPSSSSSKPKTDHSKHIKGAITVEETLKEVVPKMVNETTGQNMKDNLPMVVIKGIRLEWEKTKADIVLMVVDAVRKEQECTRAELLLQVSNDVATNVPPQVDAFLRNYINNNILHVHPTMFASFSIPDLQQQLYLRMKDDKQARDDDFTLWLALMYKFEKPASHVDPYRVDAFHIQDHEDHHDNDAHPEGESRAKRQRTSEKSTYTRGESSSKTAEESYQTNSSTQEQQDEFDAWSDD